MVFILELIGTVAFAFSGCMVANSKKMDIFGVWVLGTVTAVGGGAVRDVLLGIFPPNMFRHGSYVAVAMAFSKRKKLSDADVAELRKLIDEYEEE